MAFALSGGRRVQLASRKKSKRPALAPGAVAQLGERLICIQEVAGSIPTSSTRVTGL